MDAARALAGLLIPLFAIAAGGASPLSGERMAFVQLLRHGDSITVLDLSVVPGRAPLPRFPQRIATEKKWICEVRNKAGALAWSGIVPDPFAKPRHRTGSED